MRDACRVLVAALLWAVVAGCGQRADRAVPPETPTADSVVAATLHGGDSLRVGSPETQRQAVPWGLPKAHTVVDTTIVHEIPISLFNGGLDSLEIRADGGAGAVVVDTLAPGDSVRISLETRADSIDLMAFDTRGRRVGGSQPVRADDPPRRLAFP